LYFENENLREEFESLILEKTDHIPTLLELYNKDIYIAYSICDRRTKKGHKLDHKSYPTLLVSDAGLMSSNIPFAFPPIDFDGMKVIDGAFSNPFPISW